MPSKQWLEKHADAADWLTVSDELVLTKNEALLVAALRDLLAELEWRPMSSAPSEGELTPEKIVVGLQELAVDARKHAELERAILFFAAASWIKRAGPVIAALIEQRRAKRRMDRIPALAAIEKQAAAECCWQADAALEEAMEKLEVKP